MKLKSLLPQIKYLTPDFNREWMEAIRYPEFVEMGKKGWIELAKRGKVMNYSDIKGVLGNVDLDFHTLEPEKQKRVAALLSKGVLEYPMVVKFSDTDYDLIAGNTRLAGLVKMGYNPKLWVVEL
jgi:hypothetical protein